MSSGHGRLVQRTKLMKVRVTKIIQILKGKFCFLKKLPSSTAHEFLVKKSVIEDSE